jgi:hypothetical protein
MAVDADQSSLTGAATGSCTGEASVIDVSRMQGA